MGHARVPSPPYRASQVGQALEDWMVLRFFKKKATRRLHAGQKPARHAHGAVVSPALSWVTEKGDYDDKEGDR